MCYRHDYRSSIYLTFKCTQLRLFSCLLKFYYIYYTRYRCEYGTVNSMFTIHPTIDSSLATGLISQIHYLMVFTALHWMQGGLVMRKLSVCLSVCQTCVLWQNVQIFIPYERLLSLVFWEEEWLVDVTPSTWNFGSTCPRWSEIANF